MLKRKRHILQYSKPIVAEKQLKSGHQFSSGEASDHINNRSNRTFLDFRLFIGLLYISDFCLLCKELSRTKKIKFYLSISIKREMFTRTPFTKINRNPAFLEKIVFTDEATFHVSGLINRHHVRIWGTRLFCKFSIVMLRFFQNDWFFHFIPKWPPEHYDQWSEMFDFVLK